MNDNKLSPLFDAQSTLDGFLTDQRRFYSYVGQYVLNYQAIEECLETLFSLALAADEAKSIAIFQTCRGLEAKIAMVSAALSTASLSRRKSWNELAKRIRLAALARNSFAHGQAVSAGHYSVRMDGLGTRAAHNTQLHKRTNKGTLSWGTEQIFTELIALESLSHDLSGFLNLFK